MINLRVHLQQRGVIDKTGWNLKENFLRPNRKLGLNNILVLKLTFWTKNMQNRTHAN